MKRFASLFLVFGVACGGGDAPTPQKEEHKAEEHKKEEHKKEEHKEEAKAEEAGFDPAKMSDEEQMAWLMKKGEDVYKNSGQACITCHQESGEGMPGAFPPLVGAEDWFGDCVRHAGIVVHGLSGEIKVKDVTYNSAMPPQGNLSNEEIAAVITYERNSWGNSYGKCLPADVEKARHAEPPKPL